MIDTPVVAKLTLVLQFRITTVATIGIWGDIASIGKRKRGERRVTANRGTYRYTRARVSKFSKKNWTRTGGHKKCGGIRVTPREVTSPFCLEEEYQISIRK